MMEGPTSTDIVDTQHARRPGMPSWGPVFAGLLAFAVVPVWAMYGALQPGDDHAGMGVETTQFLTRSEQYMNANRLEDGSVRAAPGSPIPIVVRQFGFQPSVLRLKTGETYTLEFVSVDVMHGFSLAMGVGSMNAVLTPGQMVMKELTPTEPGTYLFTCNEYCGLGHQAMSGKIVVEGEPVGRPQRAPVTPGEHQQLPGRGH